MTIPTSDQIRAVIQQNVTDPEIGINIVDLGLVYDVWLDTTDTGTAAEIPLQPTRPGCTPGPAIINDIKKHVGAAYPQLAEVNVHFVWVPPWTPDLMSEQAKDELGLF